MRVTFICLLVLSLAAMAAGPTHWASAALTPSQSPLDGRHCYDIGPLPPPPDPIPLDWCGCTWGAVFYQGRPVADAQVTIEFNGQTIQGTTVSALEECFPYYGLHGEDLGLSLYDRFTITAVYEGRTVSRVLRALPDGSGEQRVNLVLPAADPPQWTHYAGSDMVRTLTWHSDALWNGGDQGITRHEQPFGCATAYADVGLSVQDIRAAASDGEHLWVGTSNGVSEYNGTTWVAHNPGLASTNIRALAVDPDSRDVYAGASEFSAGGVSRYDGSWHPLPDVNGSRANTVQALLVDHAGHLWVGTDGGLSRCNRDGTDCITYTTDDGLGSNDIIALAEAPDGDVWAATWSYITAQGTRGGVSRYDAQQGTWEWYTPDKGLAAWDVAAVVVDSLGRAWFGTWGGGVSLFDGTWTTYTTADGLPSNNVRSLAIAPDGVVWAGTDAGLYRFPDDALAALATATIERITPDRASRGDVITFAGDTSGQGEVLGYEWRSNLDGPLGTDPTFALKASVLSAGTHTITFRVQDREGTWSAADAAMLEVEDVWRAYLPLVVQGR